MGSIRTLLALSVVVFHSYFIFGERLIGGLVAVQAFYLISGFYMAMILNEKYKAGKGSYKLFITNRFLRIYPAYWVCLFLVVLLCVVGKYGWNNPFYLWYWTKNWDVMHWSAVVFFVFANIFLIGSDWLTYSGLNPHSGKLEFAFAPFYYNPLAFQYLFIPQIWSVGVEMTFYLFAPLMLRRKWFIQLAILIASLALRYYLLHTKGWNWDPWTYRFFPNELAFFMGGSLAYKFYVFLKEKNIPQWINASAWVICFSLIFIYPHLNFATEPVLRWYFYVLFCLCLPFIFLFSKNSKIDRFIGELSFPVYIGHHFIMFLWRQYFFTHVENMKWFGITCVLSSLVFAVILYLGVVIPIEKYRQRRVALNASVV